MATTSSSTKKSVFETLNAVNCNEHVEKKNGLTYLSWAWAWQIVKKHYPGATYTIYENEDGLPVINVFGTCMVKTGVTIEGIEHIEYLPVMDFRNASIPVEKVTTFDINKAIQRSLTKACARHGLGLYIYAGEDLPSDDHEQTAPATKPAKASASYKPVDEETYWKFIHSFATGVLCKSGKTAKERWIEMTHADAGAIMQFDADVEGYKANL